jgi:hypothetical protein
MMMLGCDRGLHVYHAYSVRIFSAGRKRGSDGTHMAITGGGPA